MFSFSRHEKNIIHHWINGQRIEYRMKLRAAIVWEFFQEGKTKQQVAEDLEVSEKTAQKWLNRFMAEREKGLYDRPRSDAPATFTVEQRCEVIAVACDKPENYGFSTYIHWNLDILTEAAAKATQGPVMSRFSVQRTLKRNEKDTRISTFENMVIILFWFRKVN